MEALIGTTIPVFIGITVIVMGFAAFMTGQGVASTWRPVWNILPYCLLLGLADRFLTFSLFDGSLLSITGYLIDTATLFLICWFAYRTTLARNMVTQYPWLYESHGPFGWREKR